MDLLFVYGTLLTDLRHPEGEKLRALATFMGKGRVSGILFDIGEYPGLVISEQEGSAVFGEFYDLSACPNHWAELDEYEGINDSDSQEYAREKVLVTTTDSTLTCWTYIYKGIVQNLKPIKSGNYLSYLEKK